MTTLEANGIELRHGQLRAVKGVSLTLGKCDVVALVGANGAGKSTFLRGLAGAHRTYSGTIALNGRPVTGLVAHERVRQGLALVPEGRRLFGSMTVEENLRLGAQTGRNGYWTLERIFEAFPILTKRRHAVSSSLSGGEQQATAIGRALMSNPDVLLLDEVSLGLSPAAVTLVYASLQKLLDVGTTLLIVEQDLDRAMRFASRIVCMLEGDFVLDKPARLASREEITAAYFGNSRRVTP